MRLEIGLMTLAFFGGMVAQDQLQADEVEWVDYGEDPMANPKFMADLMTAGAPGENHKQMAESVGEFKVTGKMWMEPGAEAMPTTATASRKTVLGGRYVIEEYKSDFMGMPFEGMLIQGYDNLAGEHVSIWMDTWSTWPTISSGNHDDQGVLHLRGTMRDVMTPKGRPSHSAISGESQDGGTMSMYDTRPGGGEFKVMELTYERTGGEAGTR